MRFLVKWSALVVSTLLVVGTFLTSNYPPTVSAAICVFSDPNDIDGDSIPDDWELNGMNINNDSEIDLDLPAMGFSPIHKDLAVEADYMQYHAPYARLDNNLVLSFAQSISDSLCNPDGRNGINLHFNLDEADEIPHQDSIVIYERVNGTIYPTWSGFDKIKDEWFGNATERVSDNSENILDAKRKIFHYAVFGHTWNDMPNSGISRGIGGMDFLVSLGHDSWPKAPIGGGEFHSAGTPAIQEGTFMHEFGHNLGLAHGGADHINNKPNYFSVMNYQLQMPSKVDNRPLDFSQCAGPPLNESNLVEKNGIGQSCPPELGMFVSCPPYVKSIISAGSTIDFSGDGDTDDVGVVADLNCDEEYGVLDSYDDWTHLSYITTPEGEVSALGAIAGDVSNQPLDETALNISQIYNGSSLGEQFDELTFEDIKNQLADTVDAAAIKINESLEEDVTVPPSALEGLAGLEMALPDASDDPSRSQMASPDDSESIEFNATAIKEAYGQQLGAESVLSSGNDTLEGNTTKALILTGNIEDAINSTESIIPTLDSVIGGSAADDLITDPDDQLSVIRELSGTIESLKAFTCTYSDCSAVNQTGA